MRMTSSMPRGPRFPLSHALLLALFLALPAFHLSRLLPVAAPYAATARPLLPPLPPAEALALHLALALALAWATWRLFHRPFLSLAAAALLALHPHGTELALTRLQWPLPVATTLLLLALPLLQNMFPLSGKLPETCFHSMENLSSSTSPQGAANSRRLSFPAGKETSGTTATRSGSKVPNHASIPWETDAPPAAPPESVPAPKSRLAPIAAIVLLLLFVVLLLLALLAIVATLAPAWRPDLQAARPAPTLLQHLLHPLAAWLRHLRVAFLAWPLNLVPDQSPPPVLAPVAGAIWLAATLWAAMAARRPWPEMSLALAWILGTHLLVSLPAVLGLAPPALDAYPYLLLPGAALATATLLDRQGPGLLRALGLLALLATLAALLHFRAVQWTPSPWPAAAFANPRSVTALRELATLSAAEGHPDAAEAFLHEAARLSPSPSAPPAPAP